MKIRYLPLLLVLTLPGCWHHQTPEDLLNEVTNNYYNLLMWKYYDKCAQFVRASDRMDFERFAVEHGATLHITSYRVKAIEYSDATKEATVGVLVTYYLYPSVTENTILLTDTWRRKDTLWFVVDPKYEEKFGTKSP